MMMQPIDVDKAYEHTRKLRDYAHKATCAITELAGGGSELFAGKIGEMYLADLPFCRERIRSREQKAHERALKAVSDQRAQKATIDVLVAALEAVQRYIVDSAPPEIDTQIDAALALARGEG